LMASLSGPIAFRQRRDPTAYLPYASASFRPVADDLPESVFFASPQRTEDQDRSYP
jgi:hypothetical protein